LVAALNRAMAAESTLVAATAGTPITWQFLAAIGIRESGFQNKNQNGGGGGVGVFQIDLTRNPNVTAAEANSLSWSAAWAAQYLNTNLNALIKAIPMIDGPAPNYLWMDISSYNTGLQGQINWYKSGQSPDYHTAPQGNGQYRNDYGSNVLNLLDCFN
jgi:membrane-bound lytic murein transglycosylase MltF